MDLDFNTLIQTATLALVTVVTAIVAIVRGTVEEAAKAGAARHAELKAENANWRTRLDQELEQVRGTERQELRFDAYAGLWKKQRPLAIYEPGRQGAFGPKEADALLRAQSDWYFDEAGGLMLTSHVRDFYFTWQDLLRTVATTPGWRAQRSTEDPAEVFRDVLAAAGRPNATATLDYLKEAEGALSTWTMQGGTRADTWRKDISGLSDEWMRLSSEQQWAVLQQVSSTLRTAMVFDLESRMR